MPPILKRKPNPTEVLCANCRRRQPDRGKGQTCDYCGCSPVPSYSYPASDIRHPVKCKCNVDRKPVVLPIRQRRTPAPTLKI